MLAPIEPAPYQVPTFIRRVHQVSSSTVTTDVVTVVLLLELWQVWQRKIHRWFFFVVLRSLRDLYIWQQLLLFHLNPR
eukprot:787186-Amphidinium_carterae.1